MNTYVTESGNENIIFLSLFYVLLNSAATNIQVYKYFLF